MINNLEKEWDKLKEEFNTIKWWQFWKIYQLLSLEVRLESLKLKLKDFEDSQK